MKKKIILLTGLNILSVTSFAQGIIFNENAYETSLKNANKSGKLIFIDLYTTWCPPCKKLVQNTFPNPEVGDYFNKNFISLKFNAEKGQGKELASKFNANSYPTLLFIDGNEKLVKLEGGYKDPKLFIVMGKSVLFFHENKMKLDEMAVKYNAGENTSNSLKEYYDFGVKCGYDYNDVLHKYLLSIDSNQWLDKDNINYLLKLKTYDEDLVTSILKTYMPLVNSNSNSNNVKLFYDNMAIYISKDIQKSLKEGDVAKVKKLCILKSTVFSKIDSDDPFFSKSMNLLLQIPNGAIIAPMYLKSNQTNNFIKEMNSLGDYLIKVKLPDHTKKTYRTTIITISTFIKHLKDYMELYPDEKNKRFHKRFDNWVLELNKTYPSCKIAAVTIGALRDFEKDDLLKEVAKIALAKGVEKPLVFQTDVNICKQYKL